MKNKNIIQLIEIIRNKGCCYYTQNKAYDALTKIKNLITEKEYNHLCIALGHVEVEGADELYDKCKQIFEKYKS